MCRANLSLSFDREGVSYFTVLSNDVNRHSNLNSKVRFNTGCFNIYSGKIQIGTLRHSNVKRQLLFKPKKKKEKMLSQSFLQIYRILLHFIGKEVSEIWNFVGCKLQMYLFSFSFLFFFFFFFQTSTPSNALNLNLPRSVQQLTHHDQMEFYTHRAILFML